ncbi:hypothetical protein J2X73_002737 [Novosphingobium sp. 1748]|uniref:hypothetical protein n=1 Tax=Novosphingobium sp. 63-713 TaxID=1895900 RepID=UPI0025F09B86|nr:hypothetical protein [Novosphingobium sp. 63-713]MDR6708358.1 hypothetical protein [Novosphingobium sp. 1748]
MRRQIGLSRSLTGLSEPAHRIQPLQHRGSQPLGQVQFDAEIRVLLHQRMGNGDNIVLAQMA